jgi:hypothetical protein
MRHHRPVAPAAAAAIAAATTASFAKRLFRTVIMSFD